MKFELITHIKSDNYNYAHWKGIEDPDYVMVQHSYFNQEDGKAIKLKHYAAYYKQMYIHPQFVPVETQKEIHDIIMDHYQSRKENTHEVQENNGEAS